jgi:hypothetical protein
MREETARRAKMLNVTYKAGDDKKTNDMALDLIHEINRVIHNGDILKSEEMIHGAHNAMNIPFRIEFEANEHLLCV